MYFYIFTLSHFILLTGPWDIILILDFQFGKKKLSTLFSHCFDSKMKLEHKIQDFLLLG